MSTPVPCGNRGTREAICRPASLRTRVYRRNSLCSSPMPSIATVTALIGSFITPTQIEVPQQHKRRGVDRRGDDGSKRAEAVIPLGASPLGKAGIFADNV